MARKLGHMLRDSCTLLTSLSITCTKERALNLARQEAQMLCYRVAMFLQWIGPISLSRVFRFTVSLLFVPSTDKVLGTMPYQDDGDGVARRYTHTPSSVEE